MNRKMLKKSVFAAVIGAVLLTGSILPVTGGIQETEAEKTELAEEFVGEDAEENGQDTGSDQVFFGAADEKFGELSETVVEETEPWLSDWYTDEFQDWVDEQCTCRWKGEGLDILEHADECQAYQEMLQKKCTCGMQGDILEHEKDCAILVHLREAAQVTDIMPYAATSGTEISAGNNGWTLVDNYDRVYDSSFRQISFHANTEVQPFCDASSAAVEAVEGSTCWFVAKKEAAAGHFGYRVTNVAFQDGKAIDAVITLVNFNPYVYSTSDEAVKVMTALGVRTKKFSTNSIAFHASGGDQALRVDLVEHGTDNRITGNYGFRIGGINYGQRYGICARSDLTGKNSLTGKYYTKNCTLSYETYSTLGIDWNMINAPQSGNEGTSVYLEVKNTSSFYFFIGAPGDHENDHPGHRYSKAGLESKREAVLEHNFDDAVPLTVHWSGKAYGPKDPIIRKFVSKTGDSGQETAITLDSSASSFYYDFEMYVPYDEPTNTAGCALNSLWISDTLPAGIDYDHDFYVRDALTGADCTGWFTIKENEDDLTISATAEALESPAFYENTYRIKVKAKMDPAEVNPSRTGDSYTYTMVNSGTLNVKHKNDSRGNVTIPTGDALTTCNGTIDRAYNLHKYVSVSGKPWTDSGNLADISDVFRFNLTVDVPYNEYAGFAEQFVVTDTLPEGLEFAGNEFYAENEDGEVTGYFAVEFTGKTVTVTAFAEALSSQAFYGKHYNFVFNARMIQDEIVPEYRENTAVFAAANQFGLSYRHKTDVSNSALTSNTVTVSGCIGREEPESPVKKVNGSDRAEFENRGFTAVFSITQAIPSYADCWYVKRFSFEDILEECFEFQSAKVYVNQVERAAFSKGEESRNGWNLSQNGQKITVSAENGLADECYGGSVNLEITVKLKNGCSLEKYYVSSEEPGILESHIPNRGTSIWEWTKGSTEIVTKNTGMVQAILKETIPKGQITIEKNSADSGEPLKDAVYQVTAKEDIVSPAGVVLMKAGTEAGSVTTGTDGKAVVGNLYAGKYTVRELRPPGGYTLNPESQDVEIRYTEGLDGCTEEKVSFCNEKTLVFLQKVSEMAPGEKTQIPLSGVKFSVWNKQTEESQGETVISDEMGMIRLEGLEPGTYCFREISAPDGYASDDQVREFVVDEYGQAEKEHGHVFIVENQFIKAEFGKTDKATGQPVSGAKLQLTDQDGNVVDTWISEKTPHRINRIPSGSYTLTELSSPSGYQKGKKVTCVVEDTPFVQSYTLTNIKYVNIHLKKMIQADDIVWAHGNPVFSFYVTGTDLDGAAHTWYDTVEFTEEKTADSGMVSLEAEFTVPAGKYTAGEEKTARYALDGISDVTNGTVSNDTVLFDLTGNQDGEAVFINKKITDRGQTDTAFVRNTVISET